MVSLALGVVLPVPAAPALNHTGADDANTSVFTNLLGSVEDAVIGEDTPLPQGVSANESLRVSSSVKSEYKSML